ncbi:MAG: alpha/beta hydrolase [Gemmatimonadales bacterium]
MTSLLTNVAVGLALLYVGLLAMVWWFQDQIVFQPPHGVAQTDVAARQVRYRTSDGLELFAYIVGTCNGTAPLVLAFHGNADLARWLVPWASEVVRRTGACIMLPEYRGYDGAPGRPTYAASARDARAALDYARASLHLPPDRVVLFGHSLGTAVAAELAAVVTPRALVLQAPFSTARAIATRTFTLAVTGLWPLISHVHFDTLARVRALSSPVWVAHGDRDIVIPVRMGRAVFAAAAHPGELLIVPGAGHNDVAEVGGALYWSWLARAIESPASPTVNRGDRSETRQAP